MNYLRFCARCGDKIHGSYMSTKPKGARKKLYLCGSCMSVLGATESVQYLSDKYMKAGCEKSAAQSL